jgi:hypothetical protein
MVENIQAEYRAMNVYDDLYLVGSEPLAIRWGSYLMPAGRRNVYKSDAPSFTRFFNENPDRWYKSQQ